MIDLLALSVGIGLVVGLLFTELFGIASAGLIVPGYIALYLTKPMHIAATITVALATFVAVRFLTTFLVVYGRRRTALMILIGFIFGMLLRQWSAPWAGEFSAIGFIIPGLIAVWMDRQSVVHTLASLTIISVVVRLVLVLVAGVELLV